MFLFLPVHFTSSGRVADGFPFWGSKDLPELSRGSTF